MVTCTLDLSRVTPMNRQQIEQLAHVAGGFESRILLEHNNREINGKSMLGLLSLGVTGSDPVIMTVQGEDEEEAAREIKKLLDSGVKPPQNAADAEQLMQRVAKRYREILGENLTGVYLHGSLAAGCFQWDRSDVDFLTVVQEPLTAEKKIALAETLYSLRDAAPPSGFEMSVLRAADCRNPKYPMHFDLHVSKRYQQDYERDARGFCERMHGEDPDLTAHVLALHAYGMALCGPSISRVFGKVRREDALSAIRYDAALLLRAEPVPGAGLPAGRPGAQQTGRRGMGAAESGFPASARDPGGAERLCQRPGHGVRCRPGGEFLLRRAGRIAGMKKQPSACGAGGFARMRRTPDGQARRFR